MSTEVSIPTDEELQYRNSLERFGVPPHLHGGILRYVLTGVEPGSFLKNIIRNDLMGTVATASEDISIEGLRATLKWFYNETPSPCWKSANAMQAWMARKAEESGGQL